MIVSICIGPLEDFSARDDCLTAVFQEIELLRWVAFALVQQQAFLLDDGQELDSKLTGSVVVGVALVVPHIALQLGYRFLSLGFFCYETIVLFLFFIQIALVVASRSGTMVLPAAHADPTELKAALRARHMVASLVLLNVFIALWADFGVGGDPVNVLGLCACFRVPLLCC